MTKDAKKSPEKPLIAEASLATETPNTGSKNAAFILVVVLLSLVTGVGIIINQQYVNDTRKLLVHTQAMQQQQSNKISTLQQTLHHVIQTNQTLSEQFQQSAQQISSFINEHPYQSSDWIIQKARYYLELAQINTNWMDSQSTTIVLLKQADMILAHTHQPSLNPLRQAIAENIMTLQNAPTVDTQAIIRQLKSVHTEIIALNQISTQDFDASSNPSLVNTWQDRLLSNLKHLKNLIVVHHYAHDALQAQLMPNATALVLESVRLNLEQAQIALLNHQQTLYALTLTTILHNIQNYDDPTNPKTQHIIEAVQTLIALPINQKAPILIDLLTLFDSLTQPSKPLPPPLLARLVNNDTYPRRIYCFISRYLFRVMVT